MIDSHAHILREFYDNVDDVIRYAKSKGIIAIINCGDCIETSKEVLFYSRKYYNFIFAAVGIHPENTDDLNEKNLIILERMIRDVNVKAIGEIGLDYHYFLCDKEKQQLLFRRQLELAEKYHKSAIIHSRDAIQDTYDIIKEYNVRGVIHCFSGSVEMAQKFIKLGFAIGIGGVLTFKNAKNLIDVVNKIDLKYILLETDSPFLAPEPIRGTKNIPNNVMYVAKKIAEIKNVDVNEVFKQTTYNSLRVFDLDL